MNFLSQIARYICCKFAGSGQYQGVSSDEDVETTNRDQTESNIENIGVFDLIILISKPIQSRMFII